MTGNHEARIEEYEEFITGLENAGVHLLDNEAVEVENSGDRIPFVGGLVAPTKGLFPKYDAGVYSKEGTDMTVSRGIGNSIFHFVSITDAVTI